MIDYQYNWAAELDDGDTRTAPVRCTNCDRKAHPALVSKDGLCRNCVGRAQDDALELRAEAQRAP